MHSESRLPHCWFHHRQFNLSMHHFILLDLYLILIFTLLSTATPIQYNANTYTSLTWMNGKTNTLDILTVTKEKTGGRLTTDNVISIRSG